MLIKLSKRLAAIAELVPKGSVVADIGTDHGYLAAYLVMNGISQQVIAADVAKGPLNAARQVVELLALERKIDLRLGDGLRVLEFNEVHTVCIAGMGGNTMINIFEQSPKVLKTVQRLILQPMRAVPEVREWLGKHNWFIVDEELVVEDNKFYEILVAEQGEKYMSDDDVKFGPVLLAKKHPLLKTFLLEKINTLKDIEHYISDGDSKEKRRKLSEISHQISHLEKVISCL